MKPLKKWVTQYFVTLSSLNQPFTETVEKDSKYLAHEFFYLYKNKSIQHLYILKKKKTCSGSFTSLVIAALKSSSIFKKLIFVTTSNNYRVALRDMHVKKSSFSLHSFDAFWGGVHRLAGAMGTGFYKCLIRQNYDVMLW